MINAVPSLRLVGDKYIKPGSDGPITANLAVEDVDLPSPGQGEVLVEPLFVGICGSDNSASLGKPNFSWVERPRTIGHEGIFRHEAIGPVPEKETDERHGHPG